METNPTAEVFVFIAFIIVWWIVTLSSLAIGEDDIAFGMIATTLILDVVATLVFLACVFFYNDDVAQRFLWDHFMPWLTPQIIATGIIVATMPQEEPQKRTRSN